MVWPCLFSQKRRISIHAPRVGRDKASSSIAPEVSYFNPRAPCGARLRRFWPWLGKSTFQSTRPVWGATRIIPFTTRLAQFQSTRPVWGATVDQILRVRFSGISIHAPRVGRDGRKDQGGLSQWISIHAPRVGRDAPFPSGTGPSSDFNPRAPCGARQRRPIMCKIK